MSEKKKIELLMRERPDCSDCPAIKYCNQSNMSCEEIRLQVLGTLEKWMSR